jgi:phosphoribosylformimino-5-aminoimidazole carboxamide ribotide isomerase
MVTAGVFQRGAKLVRVTVFRPCIDLHDGQVKQIVGSTLRDAGPGPATNFASNDPASAFAARYRADGLTGGHIIKLGAGNDIAARDALTAWPGGLQLGGGINLDNAAEWLEAGAEKVIVTSWLFEGGEISLERVRQLTQRIGRDRLVIDLSCRRHGDGWRVATDRWQTITRTEIKLETFESLASYCAEFLVHAADVEGKCEGIDADLVEVLGECSPIPCTYAGGARSIEDLEKVSDLSSGRVDLTFGSSLDIFGGSAVRYADCVDWNNRVTPGPAQSDQGRRE